MIKFFLILKKLKHGQVEKINIEVLLDCFLLINQKMIIHYLMLL